jgi:CHAT domain-containing protein
MSAQSSWTSPGAIACVNACQRCEPSPILRRKVRSSRLVVGLWIAALSAVSLNGWRQAPTPPARNASPIAALTPGTSVERPLGPGESHRYGIDVAAEEFLRVSVEQLEIDVIVSVAGPGGDTIQEVDELSEHESPEVVHLVPVSGGTYRLEIRAEAAKGVSNGRYRLSLEGPRRRTAQDEADETERRAHIETATAVQQKIADLTLKGKIDAAELRPLGDQLDPAIAFFNQQRLRRRESDALRFQSLVLLLSAQYPRAVAVNERRLASLHGVRDGSRRAYALNHLAEALIRSGETARALEAFREALTLPQSGSNEAILRDNYGAALRRVGRLQEALEAHQRAAEYFKANGPRRSEGIVLSRLAIVFENVGDLQRAIDFESNALAIYREVGDRSSEGLALGNLGGWNLLLGNVERARDLLNQALALSQAAAIPYNEAHALNGLTRVHNRLGEYAAAIDVGQRALRLHEAAKERQGQTWVLLEIASAREHLGESQEAAALFERARAAAEEGGLWYEQVAALHGLARLTRIAGDLDRARTLLDTALDRIERARQNLGSGALRTTLVADWVGVYEEQVAVLQALHRRDPAKGFDRLALSANELSRARSLLDMLAASRVDVQTGVDPELLARQLDLRRRLNDKELLWRAARIANADRSRIEALEKEIDALAATLDTVETTVRARSPAFAALTAPTALSVDAIQRDLLDRDTVLLEYALGAERSWLWIVSPDSIRTYELAPRTVIETAARDAYRWLTARQRPEERSRRETLAQADTELSRALQRLSELLLAPATAQLESALAGKRLLIVAPGVLESTPFAALPVSSSGRNEAATPSVLLADHEIVHIPSASVLATLRRESAGRPLPTGTLAVIADPVFDARDPRVQPAKSARSAVPRSGEQSAASQPAPTLDIDRAQSMSRLAEIRPNGFARLPFSRAEATGIAALFPRDAIVKITDFAATKEWALGPAPAGYRMLHFATHGLIDTDRAQGSSLVLSLVDDNGQAQDGFLRLQDIYNLRLPAELVVLSACQTALGKEIGGEGLVGLTRGFMYAGARRVVASLWQVDDAATAALMTGFYRRMVVERRTPAAALRLAQLEVLSRRQWSSPFFWAAFTVQGEWQ